MLPSTSKLKLTGAQLIKALQSSSNRSSYSYTQARTTLTGAHLALSEAFCQLAIQSDFHEPVGFGPSAVDQRAKGSGTSLEGKSND